MTLLANMAPQSYRVTIPDGRETAYEWAAPVFLSVAVVAVGVWLTRGQRFRSGKRRVLLWLSIGYSAWWVWKHREDTVRRPDWADWAAVSMPWIWLTFTIFALIVKYRNSRMDMPMWFQRASPPSS